MAYTCVWRQYDVQEGPKLSSELNAAAASTRVEQVEGSGIKSDKNSPVHNVKEYSKIQNIWYV